jgi:protoheme IX farnesyltransferase
MRTEALGVAVARGRASDFVALAKPRLNSLVVATSAVGYYLGSPHAFDTPAFLYTVAGTALVASGASALNQVYERQTDALMARTRTRPLPDGRVQPAEAVVFGVVTAAIGLSVLAAGANMLAAVVALATLASYVGVYTPLKLRTSLATVVGAIPGALPPVIGWTAATGVFSREAWVLFAIVFLWQMPHFLAIAWLYREDYARAGFRMLPVIEPDGRSTARQATAFAAALVPFSLAPTVLGFTTPGYAFAALPLGLGFLALAIRFGRRRTTEDARRLFFGSLLYLPLIWSLIILARV